MKKSTNENCLNGMICPQCESMGPFHIVVTAGATVYDSGTDFLEGGTVEWSDSSPCVCHDCGHAATVKDFTE